MDKFSELNYTRPNYQRESKSLLKYKDRIGSASSYKEIRNIWLSMKESMQNLEFTEEIAFIRYLSGISNEFYKEEVRIQNIEDPHIAVLQNECDKVFLNSPYITEFGSEFGDKIVNQLKNTILLTDEQSMMLQTEEYQLRTEYVSLLSSGQTTQSITDKSYNILDKLIKVRTDIAKALGFNNYIEMAYRLHGRFDYGIKEISAFRSQILNLITPACNELRKSEDVKYPTTIITSVNDLTTTIKTMFNDISKESSDYISFIYENELFDLENRPNKRPDYFSCCMLPHYKVPFILGCFNGKGLEVNYLIHEFAHGFAFYTAARCQKLYDYHRATTSVNEIHSKSMEHFAYPYLNLFFGEQKNNYIRAHLIHSLDNLPYRCAIDEFEHAVYEDINLSQSQRCELWAEIEHKYMPWKDHNNREAIQRGTYWPKQSHLFTHPFYYIEYNISQISVFEFYGRSKYNYQQAWKDYFNLCSKGGSLNYLSLLNVGKLSNPFSDNAVTKICTPILNELFSST